MKVAFWIGMVGFFVGGLLALRQGQRALGVGYMLIAMGNAAFVLSPP